MKIYDDFDELLAGIGGIPNFDCVLVGRTIYRTSEIDLISAILPVTDNDVALITLEKENVLS